MLTPISHTPTSESYLQSRGRKARDNRTTWGPLPRAPHGWSHSRLRGQELLLDLCQVIGNGDSASTCGSAS